jgi:hypothetical protein
MMIPSREVRCIPLANSNWAPASGTLAGILVAITFFAGPNSPGDNASGAHVIAWYNSHHTSDFAFDLTGAPAILFFVLFAVALARQVRTGDRCLVYGALAWAAFGGVGFLTSIGFDSVLAQDHNRLTIASAQTLNLLENDFFLPILVGFALFGILTRLVTPSQARTACNSLTWVFTRRGGRICALISPSK